MLQCWVAGETLLMSESLWEIAWLWIPARVSCRFGSIVEAWGGAVLLTLHQLGNLSD